MNKDASSHILIVDDNQADLEYLKLILDQHKISADLVSNPIDALKIIDPDKHDIVLLDIQMPEMDGYEFVLKVKKKADCVGIPIIFISALDQKDHIQKAFSVGAQDYIQKPIIPHEVIARVKIRLKQAEQLIQLKEKPINSINDSNNKNEKPKDKLNHEKLSILNENLPRLNLLKKTKLSQNQRKKLINSIEKNLTQNTLSFNKKIKKFKLTPTEKRVVLFLISGLSSKEIAETLNVSVQTIKTHRKNIRKKIGITNQQKNLLDCFMDS